MLQQPRLWRVGLGRIPCLARTSDDLIYCYNLQTTDFRDAAMSLRRRLLASVTLMLVASLLAGSALTYWHALRKIELEMSSALTVGDNALRDALMPLLPGPLTDSQLQRIVSSFDGDRHLRARLESYDRKTAVASRVRQPTTPPPAWLYRLLKGKPHETRLELPDERGRLVLTADPLNEITEVWDDAKLKLAIVGGFCMVVLALISAMLKRALQPLEHLSNALRQVGGGDYGAHVPESGPEELAAIYRGFNAMATRLATSEKQNRRLTEQLLSVQDEERAEIARDLHDEVGPFLFAVDVDAQTLPALAQRDARDEITGRAHAIRQSVAHMQTHLKSILSRLRPGVMLDLGLSHAAEQLAAFWHARYPAIAFDIDCDIESLGGGIDETAYRILQEGTSNAVRHGQPTRIALAMHKLDTGMVVISITDNGAGLRDVKRGGFGLDGMRERLQRIGGTLAVTTGPDGRGVQLRAEIPYLRKPPAGAQQQDSTLSS